MVDPTQTHHGGLHLLSSKIILDRGRGNFSGLGNIQHYGEVDMGSFELVTLTSVNVGLRILQKCRSSRDVDHWMGDPGGAVLILGNNFVKTSRLKVLTASTLSVELMEILLILLSEAIDKFAKLAVSRPSLLPDRIDHCVTKQTLYNCTWTRLRIERIVTD